MIAEPRCRLGEQRARLGGDQRLVGIFAAARPLERIAALDAPAAQVAGLAGDSAQLLESVVAGLELREADAVILDRHLFRDGVAAVALRQVAAQLMVARQE